MENIPKELSILFFSYFDKVEDLLSCGSLSKFYNKLIKETKWYNVHIKPFLINVFNILKHFNFMKFNLSNTAIDDETLSLLKHCHTIDLHACKCITDAGVRELTGCHEINLFLCTQITDVGVETLGNCNRYFYKEPKSQILLLKK
jgi:hypothetical protein